MLENLCDGSFFTDSQAYEIIAASYIFKNTVMFINIVCDNTFGNANNEAVNNAE